MSRILGGVMAFRKRSGPRPGAPNIVIGLPAPPKGPVRMKRELGETSEPEAVIIPPVKVGSLTR